MFENKQFIDMANNGKKFDVVLMNPPYSKDKIGDEFYKKFIYKVLDLSKNSIIIHPSGIFDSFHNSKKEKNIYNNSYVIVEYIDPKLFDCGITSNIIISAFLNKNIHKIILYYKNTIKEYNTISEIRFENSRYLEKFENCIKNYLKINKDTLANHINFGPNYSGFTRRDLILENPPKNNIYIYIYKPTSNFNGILYNSIHKNNLPSTYNENYVKKTTICFILFNNNEYELAKNCINYLNTNFLKCCNLISKYFKGIKYLYYPWLDFSKSYSEEELFAMIGMEYNKEEIDKILNH